MEIRFQTSGCNSDCEGMIIRSKEGLESRAPSTGFGTQMPGSGAPDPEAEGSREKIINRRKVYSATLWW